MNLKDSITRKSKEFLALCKMHDVKFLYAFGSATNNQFNDETSDIDLLVELDTQDPITRGENLMQLWDKLELFFHRKVDLLTSASIKNPILRKNIDSSKVLIYDREKQEVSY